MKGSKGIFITGTDTGVGKTFIAAGIIRAMAVMGIDVCPMKPVESGCGVKGGKMVPMDAISLLGASKADEPLEMVNQYRLKLPLAPAVAAFREGVIIDKRKILSRFRKISGKHDHIIVEGAGGLMVPVYGRYLFADLAVDMGLPLVIVSRRVLGTINHTLLTLEAARSRGLEVLGVIFNDTEKVRTGLAGSTSPEVIRRLGKTPILGNVSYDVGGAEGRKSQRIFKDIACKIQSLIQ